MLEEDRLLAHCLMKLEKQGFSGMGTFGHDDLCFLQVALMVAALDGKIRPCEYEMFGRLAQRCDGATPERIESALDTALRSAGYLLLQSGRLTVEALAALFADEAQKILADCLLPSNGERIRIAFGMWRTMAESDGDYSEIERQCLATLFLRVRHILKEAEMKEIEESRFSRFGATAGMDLESLALSRVEEIFPESILTGLS